MIKRDKYLNLLIENRNNGFPKIITGLRRCGKSFLLKEIYCRWLKENDVRDEDILIIELDDDRFTRYRDPLYLGEYVREYSNGKNKCYVFIDEIQLVYPLINPNHTEGKHMPAKKEDEHIITFVDVILGLSRENNIDLYVTGSNSKMLSSDIITQFRDKAVNISLTPLSFDEYYTFKGGAASEAFYEYMLYGGMPLSVLKTKEAKKEYLKSLFETTYFKDIIEHNSLKKISSLDELCTILSSSTGQLLNTEKISNTYMSIKHTKIDAETVERYIGFFIDSFILRQARRYNLKGRFEIGALRKYFFIDTGLRNARLNFAFPDEGQLLETIVYNELLYNGYTVNVGTFDTIEKNKVGKSIRKTNEIDFFARKENRRYYIQVTVNISETSQKHRKLRPFLMLSDQIQKILVINRPIEEMINDNGFIIIGVTDFLLRFIK